MLFLLLLVNSGALGQQVTMTASMQSDILRQINAKRAMHRAPPLRWSPTFAASAANYAVQEGKTAASCKSPTHNQKQLDSLQLTENLYNRYSSPVPIVNWSEPINWWYSEVRNYDFSHPGPNQRRGVTGHFTALVWKSTTLVGCGVDRCTVAGFPTGSGLVYDCRFGVARPNYWTNGDPVGTYHANVQ